MKQNIWSNVIQAGRFKIKNLNLENNLELGILSDEFRKYWKEEKKSDKVIYLIDVDKVKANKASGVVSELLQRSEKLLSDILEDEQEILALSSYEVFLIIPEIWSEVTAYKESLRKK